MRSGNFPTDWTAAAATTTKETRTQYVSIRIYLEIGIDLEIFTWWTWSFNVSISIHARKKNRCVCGKIALSWECWLIVFCGGCVAHANKAKMFLRIFAPSFGMRKMFACAIFTKQKARPAALHFYGNCTTDFLYSFRTHRAYQIPIYSKL